MKTNWQHQKDAITTDQKNRTDDEHIHEEDKTRLEAEGKGEGGRAEEGRGKREGGRGRAKGPGRKEE